MTHESSISRRSVLQTSGAAITAGTVAGLSGCLDLGDDGDLFIGGVTSLSGPFAGPGENQEKGMELAVQHAMEEDTDMDITLEVEDSETDPSTGRRRAQELLQEGADFVTGCMSSAVAESISDLATGEEVIAMVMAGTNSLTGENCAPYTFVPSNSASMQAAGGIGYALEEGLGDSVYQISSDYTWGHTIGDWASELMDRHGAEDMGETLVPAGETDYASAIADAEDADPDIINLNTFAGDMVISANQLGEFGIFDDYIVTFSATDSSSAVEIDNEYLQHDNFIASTNYDWQLETDANETFVEDFEDEFDEKPFSFTPPIYCGIRTLIQIIEEEDTTDADELASQLEGREYTPQIWDSGEYFRACDHRGVTPTLTVEGAADIDEDEWLYFDVLRAPDDADWVEENQMRSCDETGCEL